MWIVWFYFFRNFREISRKMGQNLSRFAKNSKCKSIATLSIRNIFEISIPIARYHVILRAFRHPTSLSIYVTTFIWIRNIDIPCICIWKHTGLMLDKIDEKWFINFVIIGSQFNQKPRVRVSIPIRLLLCTHFIKKWLDLRCYNPNIWLNSKNFFYLYQKV